MRREEALNKAIAILTYNQVNFCKSKEAVANMNEIIEALEKIDQEQCGDCISREYVTTLLEDTKRTRKEITNRIYEAQPVTPMQKWIPVSERLPRASEIVLLSLPEHTMVDGEECFPCVICGHYIGGKSKEWGISDGTTVGYGLVAYKHCKPIAWMPLPKPYGGDTDAVSD